jgi:hypothetical protein
VDFQGPLAVGESSPEKLQSNSTTRRLDELDATPWGAGCMDLRRVVGCAEWGRESVTLIQFWLSHELNTGRLGVNLSVPIEGLKGEEQHFETLSQLREYYRKVLDL